VYVQNISRWIFEIKPYVTMRGPGEACCVPEWQLYRLGEESREEG